MGKVGVRHDGYKVLVCHVVGHSRPTSVAFAFVFVLYIGIVFTTRKSDKPWRVCGIGLVREIRSQFLFPTGVFWFFVSGSVTGYQLIVLSSR